MIESKVIYSADLKNLEPIRVEIERATENFRIDDKAIYDILLSVTEVVTNSIEHGYQGNDGRIEVEVSQEEEDLILTIRDNAPPFDPTTVETPDLTVPLEDRALGGMGIHLARSVMDEMIYSQPENWQNQLVLIKRGIITSEGLK